MQLLIAHLPSTGWLLALATALLISALGVGPWHALLRRCRQGCTTLDRRRQRELARLAASEPLQRRYAEAAAALKLQVPLLLALAAAFAILLGLLGLNPQLDLAALYGIKPAAAGKVGLALVVLPALIALNQYWRGKRLERLLAEARRRR